MHCIVEVSLSKLKRETVCGEKSYCQAVVLLVLDKCVEVS